MASWSWLCHILVPRQYIYIYLKHYLKVKKKMQRSYGPWLSWPLRGSDTSLSQDNTKYSYNLYFSICWIFYFYFVEFNKYSCDLWGSMRWTWWWLGLRTKILCPFPKIHRNHLFCQKKKTTNNISTRNQRTERRPKRPEAKTQKSASWNFRLFNVGAPLSLGNLANQPTSQLLLFFNSYFFNSLYYITHSLKSQGSKYKRR